MKLNGRRFIKLFAASSLVACNPAFALEAIKIGQIGITPEVEIGAAYFNNKNQAFGATTSFAGLPIDRNANRVEAYIKPSLAFDLDLENYGHLYGKASSVSGLTRGSTDGVGVTRDNPEDTDWDEGYVGWKKSGVFSGDPDSLVDFSVGRQLLRVGTGFLIGGGHYSQGHEGTYWIAPRLAFDETAIFKTTYENFHADVFHLRTRLDIDVVDFREKLTLDGVNVQYEVPEVGGIGLTSFRSNDTSVYRRDGLQTNSLRGNINLTKNITVSSEFAIEEGKGRDNDAKAWYANAAYTFNDTPWTPVMMYQYAYFGENYDPMLYGCYTGWGHWCQGEIVGESMLFNSNETSHMVKLSASPNKNLNIGIVGYDISFAQKPQGITSDEFAREIDVFADWAFSPHWSFGALAGYAIPGDGAKQALGTSENSTLVQGYVIFTL